MGAIKNAQCNIKITRHPPDQTHDKFFSSCQIYSSNYTETSKE